MENVFFSDMKKDSIERNIIKTQNKNELIKM